MECGLNVDQEGYFYPATEYLLEDVPTRSLFCHKVTHYQVSLDMPNQNYEARVTSLILLYYSGRQVKAVVYYQKAELS